MRKLAVVAFLILSLIAGVAGIGQAETPEPQSQEVQTHEEFLGATLEILADTTSDNGAVGMTLYRITLEPGVTMLDHEHYGSVTWYVDSGMLGFSVTSGEVWVRCANDCVPGATPDASGFVLVPEGTEVVLEAGDWIIQHGTTVHAYRNAGDTDVVIDASTSYSLEEEPAPTAADATPAAGAATPAPPEPTPAAGGGRRYTPQGCGGGCF